MWRAMLGVLVAVVAVVAWSARGAEPVVQKWDVEGTSREALVYAPASAKGVAAPLVFAWHGHGGNMRQAARSFRVHELWPEAVVIYPQGLNTPGRLTDPDGKKAGWQGRAGDLGDRDLKLFDAALKWARESYTIDDKRVYSTGHSNGGGFTYLLWASRGDVFAAVAPSSAVAAPAVMRELKPKPVFHVAGRQDPLVKFEWQQATIDALVKLNGCAGETKSLGANVTEHASATGTPVVTFIHDGGHAPPAAVWPEVVTFLKSQVKAD